MSTRAPATRTAAERSAGPDRRRRTDRWAIVREGGEESQLGDTHILRLTTTVKPYGLASVWATSSASLVNIPGSVMNPSL